MTTTIGSLDLNTFNDLYSDSTQYFWFESNASATYGAGAHVTLVPDTTFISNPTGQNILMNTDGFSIRNGLLPMMVLDNDSLDFNVIDTLEGTYTTTATFTSTGAQIGQTGGAHIQISSSGLDINTNSSTNIANFGINGARIGQSSGAHSVIDANGQRFYASNGTTQLANIGYGKGADSSGGTSNAPYYTLGKRAGTIGNYSTAEGYGSIASGFASHAEGNGVEDGLGTTASGRTSHAEGNGTIASGFASHAEGGLSVLDDRTSASGNYSHAEGCYTVASGFASHAEGSCAEELGMEPYCVPVLASGRYSHAQNYATIAQRQSQTAIGEFNIADTTGADGTVRGQYAFIIGNGIGNTARSNALTVDWNGNVQMALDTTAASGTTDGDLYAAITALGWQSDVIV